MLQENDINLIKEKIISAVNPLHIYIFGSYSNNTQNQDSDLDLFIEVENSYNIFEVKRLLNSLFFNRPIPMDFIIETSDMFNKTAKNQASFYSAAIHDKAKLIYER